MAQLISVKLSRFDGSPWGFRLQGGKDFGTPLIVQKVNGGSPAEAAGLRAGDAVIKVNSTDMYNLRHKDAQDVIVRAGNNFEMTVQRGGSTWRPSVTPLGSTVPSPQPSTPASCVSPVTKTSLAAHKKDTPLIGSGHNFSPKPFLNGSGEGHIKSIVNKQYNSPVGIYSEETIAETLSAQAEVLAGGVLGVNFKKNEKNYNAENSEVFKMVQEADKEPRSPEPVPSRTDFYSSVSHAVGGSATSPRSPTPRGGCFGSSTSQTEAQRNEQQLRRDPLNYNSAGSPICSTCDSAIVGVFVRIKEKNLHVECFKCSTCGTSLKNVGYYNINNKLYCDIHAKMVARQNAPAGMVPMTIPPTSKAPASTISSALSNMGARSPPVSSQCTSPLPFSSYDRLDQELIQYEQQYSDMKTNGYTNGLNGHNGLSNGYANHNGLNGHSKTYKSTLTIPAGSNEFQNGDQIDYNRNTTNIQFPHAVVNDVCEIVFDPVISEDRHVKENGHEKNNYVWKKAPISQNIGVPKPFGGSSINSSYLSNNSYNNLESNTLPRAQSQTVTDNGMNANNHILREPALTPTCCKCKKEITRGPFISALGQIWCPEHFICVNPQCNRQLQDIGFVEEKGQLYCEYCFERFIAPACNKCNQKVKGDCLNAIGKTYHPECFNCAHCGKLFGNNPFFLEEGLPYCEGDWNNLFTTKCFACGFPVEAGDRWVEALNNNYHSQCFNCTMCKKNLEGQSFYAKGGRPFCKNHAR